MNDYHLALVGATRRYTQITQASGVWKLYDDDVAELKKNLRVFVKKIIRLAAEHEQTVLYYTTGQQLNLIHHIDTDNSYSARELMVLH